MPAGKAAREVVSAPAGSDLLADLRVDRHRAVPSTRGARVPALDQRLSPVHRSAGRLRSGGPQWTLGLGLGPVQATLQLR